MDSTVCYEGLSETECFIYAFGYRHSLWIESVLRTDAMLIEYQNPANTMAKAKGAEWAPDQVPTPPNQLTPTAGWVLFCIVLYWVFLSNQSTVSSKQAVPLIAGHCLLNRRGIIGVSPFSAETFPISPSVLPLTFGLVVSSFSLSSSLPRLDSIGILLILPFLLFLSFIPFCRFVLRFCT